MNDADTEGLVVASHGRHVMVESADGQRRLCHPRGKKNGAVVGDRVRWRPSADEGTIESVMPRRNVLYRQDEVRSKWFAANLDQVLVLLAAQPEFSEAQLGRALIAAHAAGITPIIALNKADLGPLFARAWERLAPYRAMRYPTLALALKPVRSPEGICTVPQTDLRTLSEQLAHRVTLVLGPSGAGKSTLVNTLVPHAQVQTNTLSAALNSGRHTTTRTSLYWLDPARTTALIDSPGFQEFGLQHLNAQQLVDWMPDLNAHHTGCRYYNCTHLHEPGCAVRAAVNDPLDEKSGSSHRGISTLRYALYSELHAELSRKPY